jgi:hypothetical protein
MDLNYSYISSPEQELDRACSSQEELDHEPSGYPNVNEQTIIQDLSILKNISSLKL